MTSRTMRAMFESLEARRLLATFVVDNVFDESDGNFDPGDLSLREAIEQANESDGEDSITFEAGLSGSTFVLGGTELSITDTVAISGLGTDDLTVSGGNASRIFNIDDGAAGASITVNISGMTLTNGAADSGGALLNREVLTLTGVRFSQNHSTIDGGALVNFASLVANSCSFDGNTSTNSGGGIHSDTGASLNVVNSTFTGNTAGGGGGIRNLGTAAVTDSTFSGNTSNGVGGRGGGICSATGSTLVMNGGSVFQNNAPSGGGVSTTGTISLFNVAIFNNHSTFDGGGVVSFELGNVTLDGVTLNGNTADGSGGGVSVRGPLTMRNCTVSGNAADDSGGGVRVVNANATINNSTIAFNGAAGANGGGIHVENGAVTLNSTIVAMNAVGNPPVFNDIFLSTGGSLTANSANNLVSDANSSGGLLNGVNGNIVGADPRLAPLAANGGGVVSHALLPGSPAIDTGSNPGGLTTDQRGYARVGGFVPDIGAFETRVYPTDVAPGRLVVGAADSGNVHRVATVNRDGHVIVFEQGWTAVNLQERTAAPNATGDAVIWVDPKDNLTYVAFPSAAGLILVTRAPDGTWLVRNLTTETAAPATPTANLAQFTSVGGIVVIAGTAANGRLVAFQQNGTTVPGGPGFAFVDISAQVEANGGVTPQLTNLISYVPSWDAWHLAGIDSTGDIQSVWIHIHGTVTSWRVDNLSDITGAPPVSGQLAVNLTPWGGINLTGLDENGHLLTTWWVPGDPWRTNDLTEQFNGAPLEAGKVSGYTTPWGGLNYVGIAEDGTTTVYWWAPDKLDWEVAPLLPDTVPAADRPAGTLTSSSSAAGTLNVYGTSTTGSALRMWWQPGLSFWTSENLTALAAKT